MKKILLVLTIFMSFSFALPASLSAATNPLDTACSSDAAKESAACKASAQSGEEGFNPLYGGEKGLFYRIATLLALLAGSVSILLIIVGGISMMTSDGDGQKFSNGRNTVIYALVGLVIVTIAQAIVTFVVTRVT